MSLRKSKDWLRYGLRLKRWIVFGLLGILLILLGSTEILTNRFYSMNYQIYYGLLIVSGSYIVILSHLEGVKNFVESMYRGEIQVDLNSRQINNTYAERELKAHGVKIVAIGGGTGLSTMLRGLKHYTDNITAVVTVGDDGGSSGILRKDLGIPPPGDIRNCLVALANTDQLMSNLMEYRFDHGTLEGHCFGNIFIGAMERVTDNFEQAVQKTSEVLAITGKVLPVTPTPLSLKARMANQEWIEGESKIGHSATKENRIREIFIDPSAAQATEAVLAAIQEADAIIVAPGSLYTSIIPNFLVGGVTEAIQKANAVKIYVTNIMAQPGETNGYTVSDHLNAVRDVGHFEAWNYVIINSAAPPADVLKSYEAAGSDFVKDDYSGRDDRKCMTVLGDIIEVQDNIVRHSSQKLASTIYQTILNDRSFKKTTNPMNLIYLERSKIIQERRMEHSEVNHILPNSLL
ncbi:LPPG:FO 2-phospho-L-lactate transferase like, CofD-like [Clostridiaceae bacterium JG1575]|nr:LPPG:FO 2-phospho-L-lactate transferase like, CofD-like [Clostridiaceae bacterium JG1575]